MTKLTYSSEIREESDESVIENLVRKGWVVIPEPEPMPAYPVLNPDTHKAVYDSETNTYSVIELTVEEIQNRAEVMAQILLNEQASAARKVITDQIDVGYDVQPENFILGLSENDRTAFTQMLLLVRESLDLGLINDDYPQIIADKSGDKHTMTTTRFRQIMVSYGLYYKSLWDQLS